MVIWNDFHKTICKHGNLCLGHFLPDVQLNAAKIKTNKQKSIYFFHLKILGLEFLKSVLQVFPLQVF